MISFRLAFELQKELHVFGLEWMDVSSISFFLCYLFIYFVNDSFRKNNLMKMGETITE